MPLFSPFIRGDLPSLSGIKVCHEILETLPTVVGHLVAVVGLRAPMT